MRAQTPEYTFSYATERNFTEIHDVAEFAIDEELGKDLRALVLAKWTNQRYHDENLRAMFSDEWDSVTGIASTNRWRHRNQYYAGKIALVSLAVDFIDEQSSDFIIDAVQPTGVTKNKDGVAALSCGDKIYVSKGIHPNNSAQTVIERQDFARLHSVEFSEQGDSILTTSSSLDLIYETDLEGNPIWKMDLWDTPYNKNILGQQFYRQVGQLTTKFLHNPPLSELKDNSESINAVCVLDDPQKYSNLGLTTNLAPAFPNGASYGYKNDILTTMFHSGQAWVHDRNTDHITIIKDRMKNPHGLHKDTLLEGYMVSDTGNERISFLSNDLEHERIYDLSLLGNKKPGLEKVKWLQHTSRLSEAIYCAILSARQTITLFNPYERTRRDIPFDQDWGLQQVVVPEM